ncbi:hypothetical protein [Sphingomonas cannabina]|nr:hypothetical protein [Sphingomonas cannabina]
MTPAAKGRLIAAIALPFLLFNAFPNHSDSLRRAVEALLATK